MAATIGKDEDLDLQYGVDESEGGTSYRLFIKGSHEPIAKDDSDDLVFVPAFVNCRLHGLLSKHTICPSRTVCLKSHPIPMILL